MMTREEFNEMVERAELGSAEIAERLGISAKTVREIRRGKQDIHEETALKMREMFGDGQ